MLSSLKKILSAVILFTPLAAFCQDASLIITSSAYLQSNGGAYLVLAGNVQTDGNITTDAVSYWVFNGSTQQRITCKDATACSEIYNISSFKTVLGNVNQNNSNGIQVEVNTKVEGTHNFISGTTYIDEGTYWLDNTLTPFINNNTNKKFFVTEGHGLLKQTNIGVTPVLFPIGTVANANNYTPASLSNSSTADNFGVRVYNKVYYSYDATTGDPTTTASSNVISLNFVKKTWVVNKETAVTAPYTTKGFETTLQWNLANEDALFTTNRDDDISVVRNHDVQWFPDFPLIPATPATGAGPFTKTNSVFYDNAFYSYYPISVSGIEKILPVTGLQLTGFLKEKSTLLNWQTLTEINAEHFEVERSYDGRNFISIGSVKAFGNSTQLRKYNYEDNDIGNTIAYYRIKEIDYNGRFLYSNIVVLKLDEIAGSIVIYPNPVADHYNINFNNLPGNYSLEFFSIDGKRLFIKDISVEAGKQTILMTRTNFAAGEYLVKITDKTTKYSKTIKIHILK